MLKLEQWADLFKFSKEILDDDYNSGQRLVVKGKQKSADGSTDYSLTVKKAHPLTEMGEGKLSIESKAKWHQGGTALDMTAKNEGFYLVEGKHGIEDQTDIKGLSFYWSGECRTAPQDDAQLRIGMDIANDRTKFRMVHNISQKFYTEILLTNLTTKRFLFGAHLHVDPMLWKVMKLDYGFVWEPVDRLFLGIKHESLSQDVAPGKFSLFVNHQISPEKTFTGEYSLHWMTKAVIARAGVAYKAGEKGTIKGRLDWKGHLDGVYKHSINDNVTVSATSGLALADFGKGEMRGPKLGFGVDLKL